MPRINGLMVSDETYVLFEYLGAIADKFDIHNEHMHNIVTGLQAKVIVEQIDEVVHQTGQQINSEAPPGFPHCSKEEHDQWTQDADDYRLDAYIKIKRILNDS